jgi:hypothetical protein
MRTERNLGVGSVLTLVVGWHLLLALAFLLGMLLG